MKHKLSVSLDEELVAKIFVALSTGKYRNKSHVVEYAVKRLLESDPSVLSRLKASQVEDG